MSRWNEAEICASENAAYDQNLGQAHAGWGSNGVCSASSGDLAAEYNGWATNESYTQVACGIVDDVAGDVWAVMNLR